MIVNLPSSGPNITGYLFNEQDGSYLAGALAAMVTADASVPGINPEKVIGAIGGVQSTGIDKFIVGFLQGARDIDPEVQVLVNYSNGFGDPARGKELADAMFGQGADIVYQIAGGTGPASSRRPSRPATMRSASTPIRTASPRRCPD